MVNKPTKTGFVISHLSVRKDLVDMIAEMARQGVSPVIFSSVASDNLNLPAGVEFRVIEIKSKLRLKIAIFVNTVIGSLPKSRENFYHSISVKLRQRSSLRRTAEKIKLSIRYLLGFLPCEPLLDFVSGGCAADTSDIREFILTTPCLDPASWSAVRATGKPCHYYIYSWDHPGKADILPRDGANYMTWSEDFSKDLVELCDIGAEKVHAVGVTQFDVLNQYLGNIRPNHIGRPYIYYGCAWGYDVHHIEELKAIRRISLLLRNHFPGLTLLVRPYVMRSDNKALLELRAMENVEFDSGFTSELNPSLADNKAAFHKLSLQDNALVFIHCGTTMGFEGTHLSSPIIFLGPEWFGMCSCISKGQVVQEHFKRHLIINGSPNCVRTDAELVSLIQRAFEDRASLMGYSRSLAKKAPVKSMENVVRSMLSHIRS